MAELESAVSVAQFVGLTLATRYSTKKGRGHRGGLVVRDEDRVLPCGTERDVHGSTPSAADARLTRLLLEALASLRASLT
jgi:hypothetical protein